MKVASRILYIVASVITAVTALMFIGLCVTFIVLANNTDLINQIVNFFNTQVIPENEYFKMTYEIVVRVFISNGVGYGITAIICVIAIPIFLSANKKLDDLVNTETTPFIWAIIFGLFATSLAVAASVLALIARSIAIKRKNRQVNA